MNTNPPLDRSPLNEESSYEQLDSFKNVLKLMYDAYEAHYDESQGPKFTYTEVLEHLLYDVTDDFLRATSGQSMRISESVSDTGFSGTKQIAQA